MALLSINPATGEVLRTFPALDEPAVQQRLAQTADAAIRQRTLPLDHRVLCLRKLASLLEEDQADIARTISLETGKPIRGAVAEVRRCMDACRYYADTAVRLLAPEVIATQSGQAYVQWAPLGVILAVMPWESPLWHALRFVIPTLVAGNVVLLKHASSVPQTGLLIESLVRRAGFHRGTLTCLLIEERSVEAVFADKRVAAVTVTGTETAGRALAAQAGWLLKKSAVHLHGNDPMIVMASADVDAAVSATARALQDGSGARRIIVEADIYGEFLRRLIPRVEALRVGDPLREETEVGPLGTPEAIALSEEQIKAAVAAGGRVACGGARLIGRGNFLEPTVLTDVPKSSAVAQDLLAGPVTMLFRARNVQDAISLANTSPLTRSAAVWTNEPGEQQSLIAGVDAGFVALNTLATEDPRLPVGGARQSGYGRELGSQGIREFMVAKTVLLS